MSSNFRALFQLQFNQWSKHPKSAVSLWPLSIDRKELNMTEYEMYERNKKIIDEYIKSQLN